MPPQDRSFSHASEQNNAVDIANFTSRSSNPCYACGFENSMKFARLALLLSFVSLPACALLATSQTLPASNLPSQPPQSASTASADSMVVYVSDFDLDVIADRRPLKRPPGRSSPSPGSSPSLKKSPAASTSTRSQASEPDPEETPADRANALLNDVSESLIRALQQAGYNAQRLVSGAALPKTGLRIRGVFAEADERNRARRLLIGGEAVSPNMILFVGVNNLARPEQPLYELADPPIPDPRHGPVITVTSYAPAARYELSRDPSDEELKKISTSIASSLTELLRSNPLLSSQ
jgi:hypothetical protein